jgi:hypothetical protein
MKAQAACQLLTALDDGTEAAARLLDPNYAVQQKFDGERTLIHVEKHSITAYNRDGLTSRISKEILSQAQRFTPLAPLMFDGEWIHQVKSFYSFDLLELEGTNLQNQKFIDRIGLLRETLQPEATSLIYAARTEIEEAGKIALLTQIRDSNLEGIVLKRLAGIYTMRRGIPTGPINTFPGWKNLGRSVKKGEKALTLCMPITVKRRNAALDDDQDSDESFATFFVYKRRWFVLSQTEGPDIEFPPLPNWDASLALHNLEITQVPFTKPNGNCQGYARGTEIAINPVAQLPRKTLFHETAHLCCLRSYVVLRGQVVWNEAPAGSGLYITFPPGTYRSPLLLAGLSGLTFHAVEEK